MPIYEYEREDGTTFEVMQKISEEPLEKCPDTGLKVRRLISRVVSHFKGDGFYQTDYNGGNASAGTKGGSQAPSKPTDSSAKDSSTKSESLKQAKPKGCGTTCGCS